LCQIDTIEDPVECLLPGVTQTEIDPPAGLTFANCLRSLLRQDPEVIMVGEVRDAETARLSAEAALTGHLVITTLHAGTAPGVVARLLELGIEPAVLAGVLRLAVAQRLVRRLCPDGGGGGGGAGAGFRGRVPVAEFLAVGEEVRRAILARADLKSLSRAARAAGMRTMAEAGRALVDAGRTSAAELDRVLAGVEEG
jgi:general secretion pathway protein E